jgi:hypothetical protein
LRGRSASPLEGKALARLVYETPDSAFADRAVQAMRDAHIDCYRVGFQNANVYVPEGEAQICIYIANESDYAQANAILLKIGAAADEPLKLPPLWVLVLGAALIVVVAWWVALQWK